MGASFRNIDNVFHKFKVGHRAGQRLAAATGLGDRLTKVEGDSEVDLAGTPKSQLEQWTAAYPTASALLRELECPEFLHLVAGTTQWKSVCRSALDHWIALGRPEVSWRDAVEWECVRLWRTRD